MYSAVTRSITRGLYNSKVERLKDFYGRLHADYYRLTDISSYLWCYEAGYIGYVEGVLFHVPLRLELVLIRDRQLLHVSFEPQTENIFVVDSVLVSEATRLLWRDFEF